MSDEAIEAFSPAWMPLRRNDVPLLVRNTMPPATSDSLAAVLKTLKVRRPIGVFGRAGHVCPRRTDGQTETETAYPQSVALKPCFDALCYNA